MWNTVRIEVARAAHVSSWTARLRAHFVQALRYVQMTGVRSLTKVNTLKGDKCGELDRHVTDGNSESSARAHSLYYLAGGSARAGPCSLRCRGAPPRAPRI